MTTGTVREDVRAYLDAVRARLDDLPAGERDDLLADVEASIVESAAESDAPVELRLGPPHSFADELRAAAGLPPHPDAAHAPSRGLMERLAAADSFFRASPAARWLRELAPLWWVLRALVAVGLLETLNDDSVFAGGDYALLVALAAVLAVAVSVAVGVRHPRRNAAVILVNLVLALAAIPVTWDAVDAGRAVVRDDGSGVVTAAPTAVAPSGLVYDGQPVENIYAFGRRGRLLQDVRLFMQDGRALAIGAAPEDPNRRTVRTRGGRIVFNAFPIRYYEPGTEHVAHPAAGAPVRPGPLTTKPLGR